LSQALRNIITIIKKYFYNDKVVEKESNKVNISRIYYCSIFAAILSLSYLIAFIFLINSHKPVEIEWRQGIMLCYLIMFLFFVIIFIITKKIKNKDIKSKLIHIIPFVYALIIVIFGVIIATIDQLITRSLAPFILLSMIVSVIMLIKPLYSILITLIGCFAIYFALPLTLHNPILLASVRVNAFSTMFLCLVISNVMWRGNLSRILQSMIIQKQKEDLEKKNIELEYLAYFDSLTGMYNRRRFEELFEQELYLMNELGFDSSLAIMDVDFFKEVNDNYGHHSGDEVLKSVCKILKENLNENDLIARWGGEEFSILFSKTNLKEAEKIAQKLKNIIQSQTYEIGDNKIKLTASFGVSAINRKMNVKKAIEDCYHKADSALYDAKQNGRNRVEIYKN